jgi:molecular chaperone DnaJ
MKKRVVKVNIPPGVHEGQAVRLVGEGEAGSNGGPRGDLHCYISIKQHSLFARHGNDVVCQVPISFTQAALGGKIEVPTLDGREDLDVPGGTQHGEMFKLRGKGLPDLRTKRKGDVIVQIAVEIPKKLTERQKTLLKEFAGTEDHSVMPQRKSFRDKIKQFLTGDQ